MAANKNALKAYIDGQQQYHAELTNGHENAKRRIATHIGLILALLGFLYAGALDTTKTVMQRLFIPEELYGKIFYVAGLFFLFLALGKLIQGSRPNGQWSVGHSSSDAQSIEGMSEVEYLIKLKNDNEVARRFNIEQHDKKFFALRDSFFPMLMGAIIMIVLRYFQ